MINIYIDAFRRMLKGLEPIVAEYKKSKVFFLKDAFIAYLLYGFTPNEYMGFQVYKKSKLERKRFFTNRHQNNIEKHFNNPDYAYIFWEKQIFNKKFSEFINRDWLYCADSSKEEIRDFINRHSKIIVKPTSLSSGKGIHILMNDEKIETLISSKALIEEFIIQDDEMIKLNPTSVNTIRVYTVLDTKGKPHILSTSIRVGGKGSTVDNYHQGGIGYPLDIATGTVMMPGKNYSGHEYLFHPATGFKMIGFTVPRWNELKGFVFKATQIIPEGRLIAWDVAVTKDSFEMVEANYKGDPGFMQSPTGTGKLNLIKEYW